MSGTLLGPFNTFFSYLKPIKSLLLIDTTITVHLKVKDIEAQRPVQDHPTRFEPSS